ncbi:transposase, IS4 family [Magnetococcus marinus MC-1]|uniref:Transposase, IS4 family n=2 Tax=Magnetococcus TaxID=162171 RepID=A0L3N9_MAGMM|nr:transposase, IS4 family [Magnetococcus marinus MC-1]ABK44704.1 transposase, IS4 family [Magnetococcus marinus MC-1]ABK44952.1 transposase, IS4 family [Magnetococcus marinus MC-1]
MFCSAIINYYVLRHHGAFGIIPSMYIRRTQTRNTATGESYYTHRLVQSLRVGTKVRQVTLLNLGRHFAIGQNHWPTLCSRIDQLLSPQKTLISLDCPSQVEREAQRIVAQLLTRQPEAIPSAKETETGLSPEDVQTVLVDSLEMSRPRSVGVEQVGLWAMGKAGFTELLADVGLTGPQRAAAIGAIIGRMAAPGSERALHRWLSAQSGLGELLDVDFETMSLMQFYRVSDLLIRNREAIENRLFSKINDLFNLPGTVTLYDLTNTYFEGEAEGNSKAQRGRSKEKRCDSPLLTLGLVLDGSGFVRRSQIFPGNVSEGSTLEGMLKGLNAPNGTLVVMDRGVATEANLVWLRDKGYRYLVVSRERERQFDFNGAACIETAAKEQIHIQKVLSDDGQEVRLYCHSQRRAEKEKGISRRFAERFEAGLTKLSEGLSKPRTTKNIDKLWERIGRLKEKNRGIGQHYHIEIIPDDSGLQAQAIHWKQKPLDGTSLTHPGVYCLRSNETGWDEERLWRTYITLTDLESVFRSLKSELGLRPLFHRKEERSDGHLFITVLTYQIVQIIRQQLAEKGIHGRWSTLRDILSSQCRITASFRRPDGHSLQVRKATRPEPEQQKIFQALGIHANPGGVKKMVV